MEKMRTSTTQWLFQEMLELIRTGQWAIGSPIPSERTLMEDFGVSRISLRESLSMLRALGILETAQGRSSIVQRIDSEIIGRLFPLMLSFEGKHTCEQIFEVRLAIESRTAYLAAMRRTDDDLQQLDELLRLLKQQVEDKLEKSIETDLQFHLQLARASKNPLFPLLLNALSGFVTYVQIASCRDNPVKRLRAVQYHESIIEAVRYKDAERARVEMESHLHFSANDILKNGILKEKKLSN